MWFLWNLSPFSTSIKPYSPETSFLVFPLWVFSALWSYSLDNLSLGTPFHSAILITCFVSKSWINIFKLPEFSLHLSPELFHDASNFENLTTQQKVNVPQTQLVLKQPHSPVSSNSLPLLFPVLVNRRPASLAALAKTRERFQSCSLIPVKDRSQNPAISTDYLFPSSNLPPLSMFKAITMVHYLIKSRLNHRSNHLISLPF